MPVRILLPRLLSAYDPFRALDLRAEEDDPMIYDPVDDHLPYDQRDRVYHLGRIRYFVDLLLCGEEVDPIGVDNVCAGNCILPVPDVVDGHHRLCAAAVVGAKSIQAGYGGRVDLRDWLTGRRRTRPKV